MSCTEQVLMLVEAIEIFPSCEGLVESVCWHDGRRSKADACSFRLNGDY